jgi:hypothetical protein
MCRINSTSAYFKANTEIKIKNKILKRKNNMTGEKQYKISTETKTPKPEKHR